MVIIPKVYVAMIMRVCPVVHLHRVVYWMDVDVCMEYGKVSRYIPLYGIRDLIGAPPSSQLHPGPALSSRLRFTAIIPGPLKGDEHPDNINVVASSSIFIALIYCIQTSHTRL